MVGAVRIHFFVDPSRQYGKYNCQYHRWISTRTTVKNRCSYPNSDVAGTNSDLLNANTEKETPEKEKDSFSRLFSEEMKDDDIHLPWLDRPAEKRLEAASGAQVNAARHREGFLQRKGDWTGFWRRRYFKLFNHKLTYYRSDTDETAAQVISITNIADVVEEVKMPFFLEICIFCKNYRTL